MAESRPRFLPAAGGLAIGGWLVEESTTALHAYVDAGFDYVGVECQHSLLDERAAGRLLQLASASCPTVVRVSRNDPALIGLLLDAGADGVIVPAVDTADEARQAVAAFRYPPAGIRSFGPIKRSLGLDPEVLASRAACLVMIETRTGLDNVEAIAAVPGVDGIYVGPADLSIGLGMNFATAFSTAQLAPAFARIRQACDAHGLVLGAHALDAANATRWAGLGVQFVCIGSSTALVREGAVRLASDARGHDPSGLPSVPESPAAAGPRLYG